VTLGATVAQALDQVEGQLADLRRALKRVEAEIEEAKRDPLADVVRLTTFCERYDFTPDVVRHWIRAAATNGSRVWWRREGPGRFVWIDLRAFYEWFEGRFGYSAESRRRSS